MSDRLVPILALNSGSSSLKFGLYEVGADGARTVLSGEADSIGSSGGRFSVTDALGRTAHSEAAGFSDLAAAMARVGAFLAERELPKPAAIGHRVVHGGPALMDHCLIDASVLSQLEASVPFAPLHIPSALAVIAYAREHFADVPQVACFDTAFHAGMPEVARTLPIPLELRSHGIRRYGFHGLSCESIVRQLGGALPNRLVIAHLGNGASITAVKDGRSVDTSMGLTPTGGVIMGTRSGDLDPGILLYLARQRGLNPDQLERMVDHESGLLGISGVSGDMRKLHAAASSNDDAGLAIAMFCNAVRKQIAAMATVLHGLDMVVFTGGIGENDEEVRGMITDRLSWLLAPGVAVRVLPSLEDEQIARHAARLIPALG